MEEAELAVVRASLLVESDRALVFVILLQALDAVTGAFQCSNGGTAGLRAAQSGHHGDAGGDGSAANNDLVAAGLLSAGRVDDEMHLAVLDEIQNVWTALLQLVEKPDRDACVRQDPCRAAGGVNGESEVRQILGDGHDRCLVGVFDADEGIASGGKRGCADICAFA